MGYEAGYATQTPTEAECAAYCWGIEACQFYTYGGTGGWCYPETASSCTGQYSGWSWGSRECGAPTDACVLQENIKISDGMCQRKRSAKCKEPNDNFVTGTKECGVISG